LHKISRRNIICTYQVFYKPGDVLIDALYFRLKLNSNKTEFLAKYNTTINLETSSLKFIGAKFMAGQVIKTSHIMQSTNQYEEFIIFLILRISFKIFHFMALETQV